MLTLVTVTFFTRRNGISMMSETPWPPSRHLGGMGSGRWARSAPALVLLPACGSIASKRQRKSMNAANGDQKEAAAAGHQCGVVCVCVGKLIIHCAPAIYVP